jgi:WD40 repeat protein
LYKEDDDDWVAFTSLDSHESTVWSIAFNNAGNRLASCSDDKTIKIWQSRDEERKEWSCVSTLSGYHERPIYHVSWSPKNDLLATAAGDDSICIFRESSEQVLNNKVNFELLCRKEAAHGNDANCVDWNPEITGLLASCGDDGTIKLWMVQES